MSRYHSLGKIPKKRHTTFKKENGDLYQEELFGTAGFAGMSSFLYHIHLFTKDFIRTIKGNEFNI